MIDPFSYGAELWIYCAVCNTRRPPNRFSQKEGPPVCNDGWCERKLKLDDDRAAAEARKAAGLEKP